MSRAVMSGTTIGLSPPVEKVLSMPKKSFPVFDAVADSERSTAFHADIMSRQSGWFPGSLTLRLLLLLA